MALCALGGCSYIQSVDKVIYTQPSPKGLFVRPDRKQRDLSEVHTGGISLSEHGFSKEALVGLAQYALLADAAYELRDQNERRESKRYENSTIRPRPTTSTPDVDSLPLTIGGICRFPSDHTVGWERLTNYSSDEYIEKIDVGTLRFKTDGLKFQVWRDRNRRSPERVAIVFRGTTQRFGDWYSNLRTFTNVLYFGADHYEQLGRIIDNLVDDIKNEFPGGVQIITIGHSLGGGLAQFAAYASADIEKSYVFNNSPVTGLSSIDRGFLPSFLRGEQAKSRKQTINATKHNLKIVKVTETGEVLAIGRAAFRQLGFLASVSGAKIAEFRFNFRRPFESKRPAGDTGNRGRFGVAGQHSITQLACDMICRLEEEGKTHKTCRETPFRPN